MDASDVTAIRTALGLTRAQLGRALRLKPANAYHAIKKIESGENPVSGPVSVALEALASGWRPKDYSENVKGE